LGFGLECGSALLCRFGFSCLDEAQPVRQTKRETKAAEQSTAALQTKTQNNRCSSGLKKG
jgi:hypothetical protein